MADVTNNYLESAIRQFEYYRMLGEKTFAQLTDGQLFWEYTEGSNSIAVVVKHLSGNMLSRWTDFLTSDGEKEWRDRDAEFRNDIKTRQEMVELWGKGWDCLLKALRSLTAEDLDKIVYIRNEGHTVMEAINRQLAHYPYHIGQIVLIGKMLTGDGWSSLSVPRGNSKEFNEARFSKPRRKGHFTDDYLTDNTRK